MKFFPLNKLILEAFGKFFPVTITKATMKRLAAGRSAARAGSPRATGADVRRLMKTDLAVGYYSYFGLKILEI